MNNKKLLLAGTLTLAIIIAGAAALYSSFSKGGHSPTAAAPNAASDSSQGSAESEPQPAPDFTVLDRDGNQVALSDLRGKPVVLSFWASWCGICKTGMPDFEEVYADEGDNVHFMMVNLTAGSETEQIATDYVDENGYSFPIYLDTEMEAASAFGVTGVPITYFIDASGNLAAYGQGRLGVDGIRQGIKMAHGRP